MALTKTYIRLSGTRDVTDDLVSVGGNDYEMTFEEKVYDSRGVDTTQENTTYTATYSQSGSTLTITTTTTPSSTYPVVISFYFFLTDKEAAYEPLSITSGDVVEWRPLLTTTPRITQSIGDILEGELSVSSSAITFINDKTWLYLIDEKSSFYNQPMKIWTDYGNGSIEEVFTGKSTDFSVSPNIFSFTVKKQYRCPQWHLYPWRFKRGTIRSGRHPR